MPWKTLKKSGLEPTGPNPLADQCRWGFGWVDKAQGFQSARRFGAVGSSPDFSRVFQGIWLLGI